MKNVIDRRFSIWFDYFLFQSPKDYHFFQTQNHMYIQTYAKLVIDLGLKENVDPICNQY